CPSRPLLADPGRPGPRTRRLLGAGAAPGDTRPGPAGGPGGRPGGGGLPRRPGPPAPPGAGAPCERLLRGGPPPGEAVAVTEAEWRTCTAPDRMLSFLTSRGAPDKRRLRLVACACVRQAWHLLPRPAQVAVEVA